MEEAAKYLTTPPLASGFTTLTPAQVEAERRSAYDYLFVGNVTATPPDPTPPLLRPMNSIENTAIETLLAKNRWLNDALTESKIVLGDRHAEIRMMRVAVDVLTTRALKAEAQAAGESGPFFVGFQRRAEELQHEYFAMKQRAEKAEAQVLELQARAK